MAGILHTPAQFHIKIPQRVIRIMNYSPTLRHTRAPAVCTLTLTEGVLQDHLHNADNLRSINDTNIATHFTDLGRIEG